MKFLSKKYNKKQTGRAALYAIFALAAFSFGILIFFFLNASNNEANLNKLKHATSLYSSPRAFPDFVLTDQHGENFTNQDLKENWNFIFFGFTHCPDVCPLTLSTIDKTIDNLVSNRNISTRGVFISVDPQRDTPEKLNGYVNHFNQEIVGLTGSNEQLKALTQSIGVVYTSPNKNTKQDYTIDHSAQIFLVAPNGNLVAVFSTPHEFNTISEDFVILQSYYKQQES